MSTPSYAAAVVVASNRAAAGVYDDTTGPLLACEMDLSQVEGKLDDAMAYARRNVAVRAVRQILDRFCNGSLEQLLVGMVENQVVDRAELQQLARKLGQRTAKKAAAKGKEDTKGKE